MAVVFVLLDHLSDAGFFIFPGLSLNRIGTFGVYLFFSLSAFLLTYQFCIRPAEELFKPGVWGEYFFRRFMRIFPLYALVLCATHWRVQSFSLDDVRNHLLLLSGERHFWTILVEVKYYLILPLLLIVLAWLGKRRVWLGPLGVVALLVLLNHLLPSLENAWNPNDRLWLHRYLWVFLLGSTAGIAHALVLARRINLQRFRWGFELLALSALLLVLYRVRGIHDFVFGPSKSSYFSNHIRVCAVAWCVFLFAHLHGVGILRRIFSLRVLRYLGFVSYSAYLWHRMIEGYMRGFHFASGLFIPCFLVAVFAVASASYYLIERPLSRMRLRNRMEAQLKVI
jgi:peptidoglycan/LPS O-acetylase OafA/YrhL